MASAGIPMLATNTKAHRRILGSLNISLFDLNSVDSLYKEICLMDSIRLQEQRRVLANWSHDYTYSNKAQSILRVIGVL